jgi:hypothetical protein
MFLRQVPNPLLKTSFDRRGELQDIQWSEAGEMDVDPIFEAWQDLTQRSGCSRIRGGEPEEEGSASKAASVH